MFLAILMFFMANDLQPTAQVTPIQPASTYQVQPTELIHNIQPAADYCVVELQGTCYQDN